MICLVCLVPVLVLVLGSVANAADPNLVLWWNLDEGSGNIAYDLSGNGHDGTLNGTPEWVEGYDGYGLYFTGGNVEAVGYKGVTGTDPRTCCMWLKTTLGQMDIITWGGNETGERWNVRTDNIALRIENRGSARYGVTNIVDGQWHHVAVTFEDDGTPDVLECKLYVDGQLDAYGNPNQGGRALDTGTTENVRIGAGPFRNKPLLDALMDDVRIYNRALTQEEIQQIMLISDPLRAWNPTPADEAVLDIEHLAPLLTWSPGDGAVQHDVYFGTDQTVVVDANTSDATDIYRGRQDDNSYDPGILELDQTYYWRIDEVNDAGTSATGTVWSFSVADYVVVEDFESYNEIPIGDEGSNLVYMTWIDGYVDPPAVRTNGSTMGYIVMFQPSMEIDTVHGGRQSAPMMYDNTTAGLSEVTLTFAAQDWTAHGVQTLSLWFSGDPTNVPGQLYVKINGVQVLYDGAAGNIAKAGWQVWNIGLTSVSTNLQSVTSLAIGVEDVGATGALLLDDIRLYPIERQLVTPIEPNTTDLMAQYSFDDGTFNDSVGVAHGTGVGGVQIVDDPERGKVLKLDGYDGCVDLGNADFFNPTGSFSISVWANIEEFATYGSHAMVSKRGEVDAEGKYVGWQLHNFPGTDKLNLTLRGTDAFDQNPGTIAQSLGEWHHIAVVYDIEAGKRTIYVDNVLDIQIDDGGTVASCDHNVYIGTVANVDNSGPESPENPQWKLNKYLKGMLDDVRIYQRALSQAEVAWLAGVTEPFE